MQLAAILFGKLKEKALPMCRTFGRFC